MNWLSERFSDAVRLVSTATERPAGTIEVLVTDDAGMIEINRVYAQADHTTDVLSFDLSDGEAGSPIEAEIAICADEAARQAGELGHSMERELLLYALHGLLHCAGFDDQTEDGYRAMHAEEDRILQAIGVGATFEVAARGEVIAPPGRRSGGAGGELK